MMIILKHLTVERFRLLREIDLHFPQRGSILIQGPNESGKSTLFESIYFALYGEALGSTRKMPSQDENGCNDELIQYGKNEASVTLAVAIGPTELTITRRIKRDQGQDVLLSVRRLGMAEELITSIDTANTRIIAEIGHIDGKTLRNSCYIEQKALSRVEQLSASEREATIYTLLGLDKLTRLAEQFKVTEEDERLLAESSELLKLAEIQSHIPELSIQLGQIEAALDAIAIREDLVEVDEQKAEIAEQELALEQLRHKREEMKSQQHLIQQLRKAQNLLEEIIAAYEAIASAQRELPELEHQLADIERREHEELPALEQLVSELSDLTRTFGTMERMASDLLATVNTIKDLEQKLKHDEYIQEQLVEINDQIIHTRLLVDEVQQSQQELEAQFRSARPQLEARLQRLQALSERLVALKEAEKVYISKVAEQVQAEENNTELSKVQSALEEAELEHTRVEREAKQAQARADEVEKSWLQFSLRHQLEEWQHVKSQAQGLADAEQQVKLAHDQQEQLTLTLLAMRRTATMQLGLFIACIVLFVLCGSGVVIQALHHSFFYAAIAGIAALLILLGAGISMRNYTKTREKERHVDRQMQEAISRVGMMVAARETAIRNAGGHDALARVEREIRSLGGNVPRSAEEAIFLLQQLPSENKNMADLQQQLTESQNQALSAQNLINVSMEAMDVLRKEQVQLQDIRRTNGWDEIEDKIRIEEENIAHIRSEITTTSGEEGLSIILTAASDREVATSSDAQLRAEIEKALTSTEREIANIDSKRDLLPELVSRLKAYQGAVDTLLARKLVAMQQHEQFLANDPLRQLERNRERQDALREALRNLQDSLRLRVQSLGLSFGQTAISTAEAATRKQLESLHFALGRKLAIQDRHSQQAALLKESQESLSEYYRQLAKYSGSLGGWIIPPNPFAETLQSIHARCEREIQKGNEPAILKRLDELNMQEGASLAKIELCKHTIKQAHERIAVMLVQRSRPPAKTYSLIDISAVWPLVGENSPENRAQLEEQLTVVESDLHQLEQQELEASTRLNTGSEKVDLEQARKSMQQQEHSYQTKKRGNLLINATIDRLMRKMTPRIEYFMQQLLPLLTRGRYHDVIISTEPENDGAFQLSIWEQAAAEYIPQSALSGGTVDQVSLAMRLAFTIAALPRELSAVPGFILLDEPLSLASQDRMLALIDLVTGHILSEHFEQTFFISHSNAFDPSMFKYHLYIDNGTVIESNLPAAPDHLQQETPGDINNGSNGNELPDHETDVIASNSVADLSELII